MNHSIVPTPPSLTKFADFVQLKDYRPPTKDEYVRYLRKLGEHYQCDPASLSQDQVRAYFLFLRQEKRYGGSAMKLARCALRAFFRDCLHVPDWTVFEEVRIAPPQTLPLVLARELTKLFESIHACPLGEALDWLRADANRQRGEFVLLVSGAPPADKAMACKQLAIYGTAEAVPASSSSCRERAETRDASCATTVPAMSRNCATWVSSASWNIVAVSGAMAETTVRLCSRAAVMSFARARGYQKLMNMMRP